MNRLLLELFKLAALLGCGLSLAGLVLAVWFRVEAVMKMAPGGAGFETRSGILGILDAFKEPGIAFLLSALLLACCEIAVRLSRRRPDRTRNSSGESTDSYN
jgi:hypothetical protein